MDFSFFKALVSPHLRALGFVLPFWSGFSMRWGVATSLALLGTPAHVIRAMGRWSSLYYQRYIHLPDSELRQASLQMADSPRIFRSAFGGIPARTAANLSLDNIGVAFNFDGSQRH
jgi:hypothetical protein